MHFLFENIITKEQRKEIKEELHEIKKKRLRKAQKERTLVYLIELLVSLTKQEKYQYSDYHDLDYFGVRDIENLSDYVDDYYKPILTKSSFRNKCQYYEIRGDRYKVLSLKQYITTIIPELTKLINETKTSTEDEKKAQFIMSIRFRHDTDIDKSRTFHVRSDNVEFRMGSDTDDIIISLLDSFFVNYEYEENILRDSSNYSFDYVDMSAWNRTKER